MTVDVDAEVPLSQSLVRSLLQDQAPHLGGLPLSLFATGLDNALWRLGRNLLVRLPRRAVAAILVINEQRWLPRLGPQLPLPVPVPVHAGTPGRDYPWPWSVVPLLPGDPAHLMPELDAQTATDQLANFLRALHVAAPVEAPHNPVRGDALRNHEETFHQRIGALSGTAGLAAAVAAWRVGATAPEHSGNPVWLHGDLHPGNLLVSQRRLSGVLDFGDICAGDPATDFGCMWLLPGVDPREVIRRCGGDDAALVARSRGWAAHMAVMLLSASLDHRLPYEAIARRALLRIDAGE